MYLTLAETEIFLPILFLSPLGYNQRFRTLKNEIPAIMK